MRRNPVTIALLGIDGCGKTTQARRLAVGLRDQGVEARYFENAGGRPVLDGVARRLGREDGRALIGARGVVATETALRGLAIARSLRWARRPGRVAVMDRYAYCQYALMAARRDGGIARIRRRFRAFPAPDLVLYLAVPEIQAQARVEARGYDRECLSHLVAYSAAYEALPEFPGFTVVDATGSEDEVAARVLAAVRPALRGR